MPSSRRKALAALTGTTVLLPVIAQTSSAPATLSKPDFDLLNELTERIIPRTSTPGASDAGVARIIDSGLANDTQRRERWQAALAWVRANGGNSLPLLEKISKEKDTEGARHFALLKGETIDVYYSTIEGLKTELGWNANTYLPEFKGCTHPEHQS